MPLTFANCSPVRGYVCLSIYSIKSWLKLILFSWGVDWISELWPGHWSKWGILSADLLDGEHLCIMASWYMCSACYNGNGHSLEVPVSTAVWNLMGWHALDLAYCVHSFPTELTIWWFVQALHWHHDPLGWPCLSCCPILDDRDAPSVMTVILL